MHGDNDTIVSPVTFIRSKRIFRIVHGMKIKTKIFKDCDHHNTC